MQLLSWIRTFYEELAGDANGKYMKSLCCKATVCFICWIIFQGISKCGDRGKIFELGPKTYQLKQLLDPLPIRLLGVGGGVVHVALFIRKVFHMKLFQFEILCLCPQYMYVKILPSAQSMRKGECFVVCVCVGTVTFEVYVETSILAWWYILTISRSSFSIKAIGSW